jgi:hypothetical protein
LRAPPRDPALAAARPPFRFPPRFDDPDAFDLPLELIFLFATSCLLGE